MIDSDTLKPASDAYQAARSAWNAALTALAKADTANMSPHELLRLQDEVQQTHESVFAAGNELAEDVVASINGTERAARE